MKTILTVLLSIFMSGAIAAPFAVTSEVPAADQVTSMEFSVNAGPWAAGILHDTGTGHVGYFDLMALAGTGQNNVVARACNVWGCGNASPLFSFPTAVPSTPSVTGLVQTTP